MILGIGLDVVETERISRAMERHGERFLDRFLTLAEKTYCLSHQNPVPHVAARFAAKEAVSKALGCGIAGGIQWMDIEIERDAAGCPQVVFHGPAKVAAEEKGVAVAFVSLTHTKTVAAAQAVLSGGSSGLTVKARTFADSFGRGG
jgi:holo-[acyl-carrier protein] synthase